MGVYFTVFQRISEYFDVFRYILQHFNVILHILAYFTTSIFYYISRDLRMLLRIFTRFTI